VYGMHGIRRAGLGAGKAWYKEGRAGCMEGMVERRAGCMDGMV
jgi:hypothetical protein